MGDADTNERYAAAQANVDRLNKCPRHEFSPNLPGIEGGSPAMFGRKIECKRCGGHADLLYVNAYIRGYEASGKSGNDIMLGWREEQPKRKFFKGDPDT